MNDETKNWLAPANSKIPDFIICGAMKAGTTTLHHILNLHPHVFIPNSEIHFFDIDNILQHPDFSFYLDGKWTCQNINENTADFWDWYSSFFIDVKPGQVIGEDSTTYISSEKAALRIALQEKNIKIIVSLRHPTARAYSQYWHFVVSGRTSRSFEDTIRYNPWSVLQRSLYREQISNFLKHIPRERIKFIIFEEFLNQKEKILHDLCRYLHIDYDLLPETVFNLQSNKTRIPKFINLQLTKNRIFRKFGNSLYRSSLPMVPKIKKNYSSYSILDKIEKFHRQINPLIDKKPPEIASSTKEYLDVFFKKELDGINDIVGKDVLSIWSL